MKRFLVGLGLLAAVLVPGGSALAAAPTVVVTFECYTEHYGHITSFHYAPANKKPVQEARASFEDYLTYILDDSCIPGTLEYSVRPVK